MRDLGLYCSSRLTSDKAFSSQPASRVSSLFANHEPSLADHIVNPFSFDGQVATTKDWNEGVPRWDVTLRFPDISGCLTSDQSAAFLASASSLQWLRLRASISHLRPPAGVKSNPRSWWVFAVNAVLVDVRRRVYPWTWSFIKARRDARVAYVELWVAAEQAGKAGDAALQERIQAMEDDLSVADIILYRALARAQVRVNYPPNKKPQSDRNYDIVQAV